MITERINIDVRPGGVPVVIHVTQYEAGLRQFIFTPYASDGELTVVAGSATLEGTKPDGYAFQQACEMVDGVITYTLQEQLCAVEGRVWSRLVIRDTDSGMIGYTAIVWVVGCAGVKDDAVMSDSDISALRQFLDEFGTIDAYRGALNGALAAVGGPLVAATAAAMTDRTKVYVYTGSETGYTSGHWYYWNGSAWTDGGVYQSTGINTDKTLTVSDMAADGKKTGDELNLRLALAPANTTTIANNSDLNNITEFGNYRIRTASAAATIANTPANYGGRLFVFGLSSGTALWQLYITSENTIYSRGYISGSWSNWEKWAYNNSTASLAYNNATAINTGDDLNNYTVPGNYYISTSDIAQNVDNCPSSASGRLTVITTAGTNLIYQEYISSAGVTFTRAFTSGAWTEWKNLQRDIRYAFTTAFGLANAIGQNEDLNNYTSPGNYYIATSAIAQTVSNCPSSASGRLTVITTAGVNLIYQEYISTEGITFTRAFTSGAWTEWNNLQRDIRYAFTTAFGRADAISQNEDLNNYTSPGNYYIETSAIAQTISNCPSNTGCRLTVVTLNNVNAILQTIITSAGIEYKRVFSSGSWSRWDIDSIALDNRNREAIPELSDLNDYTQPGNYVIKTAAIARTLKNYPSVIGGTLTALAMTSGSSIVQILCLNTSEIYTRAFTSGAWTLWTNITSDTDYNDIGSVYSQFLPIIKSSTYNIAFANAVKPLSMRNYLGNTENVHPKVLYIDNGFGGHKYWMAYTPYPHSIDRFENPCIAYSDDGLNWTNISNNPLDDPVGTGYNSDTHLVYRSDTDTLECWYRYYNTTTREKTIYRQTSTDGITWSEKESIKTFSASDDCLSPAIEWNGTNYQIWCVSAHQEIEYYTVLPNDITNWTKVRTYNISFSDDGLHVLPWHIDVINDSGNYIMLVMCRNGTQITNNKCSLFICTSTDNITYSTPYKVISGSLGWDKYLYRSCIVKITNKYRIYYSAGSGGTTTIYNNAIWGIGIAESETLNNFYGLII